MLAQYLTIIEMQRCVPGDWDRSTGDPVSFKYLDTLLGGSRIQRVGAGSGIGQFLGYMQQYYIGCCGRFGRGASLYRYRSQLFGRLWVRLPLPNGQFSEI